MSIQVSSKHAPVKNDGRGNSGSARKRRSGTAKKSKFQWSSRHICPRCGETYDAFYSTCANDGEVLKVIPATIPDTFWWQVAIVAWSICFTFLVLWGAHQI